MNTITDDQIAEIVREFNRNSPCAHCNRSPIGFGHYHRCDDCGRDVPTEKLEDAERASDKHDELSAALSTIITRLREAERDAARYQFLRESGKFSPSAFGGWALNCGYTRAQPSLLDAAIDAAMQESEQ